MNKEEILLDALNTFGNFTTVTQEFNENQLEAIYEAMELVKNNAVLPHVMSSAIEQFNCRFHHIQEMVANKGITKQNLITIQMVEQDKVNGDLYKVVHWA